MQCLLLCGKNEEIRESKERKEIVRQRETRKTKEKKAINWTADEKKDWGRREEMKIDHHKIKEMVPKRFHLWLKVFGKVMSERMPVRKVWDYAVTPDTKIPLKSNIGRLITMS